MLPGLPGRRRRCRGAGAGAAVRRRPGSSARGEHCAGRQRLAHEHQHHARGCRGPGGLPTCLLHSATGSLIEQRDVVVRRRRRQQPQKLFAPSGLSTLPCMAAAAAPQIEGPPGSSPSLRATVKLWRNEGTGDINSCGPTVRVHPGDVFQVALRNELRPSVGGEEELEGEDTLNELRWAGRQEHCVLRGSRLCALGAGASRCHHSRCRSGCPPVKRRLCHCCGWRQPATASRCAAGCPRPPTCTCMACTATLECGSRQGGAQCPLHFPAVGALLSSAATAPPDISPKLCFLGTL